MIEHNVHGQVDHKTNQFVVEGNIEAYFEDPKLYDEFVAGQKRLQEWIKGQFEIAPHPENRYKVEPVISGFIGVAENSIIW